VRKILDRAERPRRGQRIAGAPEHTFITHPPFDERLDDGGLTSARLAAHHDHASPPGARVVGPGPEFAELVIALSEPHSS